MELIFQVINSFFFLIFDKKFYQYLPDRKDILIFISNSETCINFQLMYNKYLLLHVLFTVYKYL